MERFVLPGPEVRGDGAGQRARLEGAVDREQGFPVEGMEEVARPAAGRGS